MFRTNWWSSLGVQVVDESAARNVVLNKSLTMDNVRKSVIVIRLQTSRFYFLIATPEAGKGSVKWSQMSRVLT